VPPAFVTYARVLAGYLSLRDDQVTRFIPPNGELGLFQEKTFAWAGSFNLHQHRHFCQHRSTSLDLDKMPILR
jgi:hypothetical protein